MSAIEPPPTPANFSGSRLQESRDAGSRGLPASDAADGQQPANSQTLLKKKLLATAQKEGAHGPNSSMETTNPAASHASSPSLPSPSQHFSQQRPSSPNMPSAASSMIFERNVQESTIPIDVPSAIPAHIKTEDQIPPALEASSLAITDDHLGPEEVEIVTHVGHQNAAEAIAHNITSAQHSESHLPLSPQDSQHEQQIFHSPHELDEAASNYGALDPNDVRRLSFISFADVVHAEHAESSSKESLHHLPLSGTSPDTALPQASHFIRPISPTRSPMSSYSQPFSPEVTTPPTSASGPGSAKGVELSPARSQTGSPLAMSPHHHGELAIETLGQALRKPASRDLSGFNRSPPSSAI
ncbi:hypothetical protein K461DRAFT_266330 [Myriangium duriaei CBS 260.36]|uniref:Uncharacterized protein n=1 Tax=Myriangium duriaei CBS 260.36 TaxID=1168546 RepID=A0A9P4J4N5_9PEZI|nr:hypothetical protein K461DRAFT_266330 [Myriangium duriaei CBS 260.36]